MSPTKQRKTGEESDGFFIPAKSHGAKIYALDDVPFGTYRGMQADVGKMIMMAQAFPARADDIEAAETAEAEKKAWTEEAKRERAKLVENQTKMTIMELETDGGEAFAPS